MHEKGSRETLELQKHFSLASLEHPVIHWRAFWIQKEIVNIWVFISSPFLLLQLFLKAGQHSGRETTLLVPGLYGLVASHRLSSAGLGLLLEQEASEHLPRCGGSAQPHVDSKGNKFWMPCKGLWTWRSALFNQVAAIFCIFSSKIFQKCTNGFIPGLELDAFDLWT